MSFVDKASSRTCFNCKYLANAQTELKRANKTTVIPGFLSEIYPSEQVTRNGSLSFYMVKLSIQDFTFAIHFCMKNLYLKYKKQWNISFEIV